MAAQSSKENRITELTNYLVINGAEAKRSELIQKFSKKFKVSANMIDRYLAEARPIAQKQLKARQSLISEASTQETLDAVKNGLKSKNDRLAVLQNEVDNCISELEAGTVSGKKLDVYGKVALRKTIKELQSEISKIEGDYAPLKQIHDAGPSFLDFLKQTSAG